MNHWKNIRVLCTAVALLLGLAATPAAAEAARKISKRPDGSTIYWSIEHPSGSEPRGLLLIAQGSGCLPAIQNPTVAQGRSIAPDFSILLVEKYGVTHTDKPESPMSDCPEEYFARHTVSQRADDVVQVVGELKEADWWNGQLVLFGGSEGGAVVARLAPRLQPDAAVVFSSGLGESLAESLPRVIPPPAAREAEAKFAEARENPESSEVWGGNSYRWWADIVDDVLVNHLLKTEVPVLLVNGERDSVQSARAARDAYKIANRCELTYWEFPDYDHFMTDSDGNNHRKEVFAKISEWIDSALSGGETNCPETNTGV
ncbi:alpha/beta hydrolase [Microbulbifer sp.]|uniref:alpha/beta hydrolase n=1 Tax=Microbulbifer sp. TaxID=1908541 RepID=UPI003F35E337